MEHPIAKKLFDDGEQRYLSAALFQRARHESKGQQHLPPKLYLALNKSQDDVDLKDLMSLAAMEMGEVVDNDELNMRQMVECPINIDDDRFQLMEKIGKEFGGKEELVCAYLVSEMWHSRNCLDEKCKPEQASDRELELAVAGMSMDGRVTFQHATVTHEGPNEDQMIIGEDSWVDGMDFPLLDAFWKGYIITVAEKMGISKRRG